MYFCLYNVLKYILFSLIYIECFWILESLVLKFMKATHYSIHFHTSIYTSPSFHSCINASNLVYFIIRNIKSFSKWDRMNVSKESKTSHQRSLSHRMIFLRPSERGLMRSFYHWKLSFLLCTDRYNYPNSIYTVVQLLHLHLAEFGMNQYEL